MIDLDAVIRGLEHCLNYDPDDMTCPDRCPYSNSYNLKATWCAGELMKDALALLKEDEPKILSIDEVKHIGITKSRIVFIDNRLEEKDNRQNPRAALLFLDNINDDRIRAVFFGDNDSYPHHFDEYEQSWRVWSNFPTNAQKMSAAWKPYTGRNPYLAKEFSDDTKQNDRAT